MGGKIIQQIVRGIAYGLLAFAGSATLTFALVSYPPAALLQPGDITSTMIRDGEITYLDLNGDFSVGLQHIGSSTTNGVLPILMNEGMTSEVSLNFATGTKFLGLGSTSPGVMLAVGGTGVFSNNLYTGNFTATGTTNFGGNSFTWPTDANSSSTALLTNGTGGLSWGTMPSGSDELCDTTIAVATTSIICEYFEARDWLRVIILFNENVAGVGTPRLRFNSDTGTNYSSRREAEGGADATEVSASGIILLTTGGDGIMVCDILNITGQRHYVWCNSTSGGAATAAPQKRITTGIWDNTARIEVVQWIDDGGATIAGVDSRIIVQGSAGN